MTGNQRLKIQPLTLELLLDYTHGAGDYARNLGVANRSIPVFGELKEIHENDTIPRMESGEKNLVWVAVDRQTNLAVAELLVKDSLDETGTLEIGYGTYPEFFGAGYMTEMIACFVEWAKTQPEIRCLTAETKKDNEPSIKVLVKNNFRQFDEDEQFYWWELNLK